MCIQRWVRRVVGRVGVEMGGGNSGPGAGFGRFARSVWGLGVETRQDAPNNGNGGKETRDSMMPMKMAIKMGTKRCRVSCQSRVADERRRHQVNGGVFWGNSLERRFGRRPGKN